MGREGQLIAGQLEQLRDGRPVPRGRRHAEALAGEHRPELGTGDAGRMPREDLAPADDELLAGSGHLLELSSDGGAELSVEEADLVALGVGGNLAERIPLDDGGELGPRPD